MKFPIPTLMTRDIYQLSPQYFTDRSIRFIMLDLDNTLAPYHVATADTRLLAWVKAFQDAGLTLYLLSNNKGNRPEQYAAQLGIDFSKRAKKPGTTEAMAVMNRLGFSPSETAIVGDQIYTDVLCGIRCGITAVCVRPISMVRNPLMVIRYLFELPFRGAYHRRNRL